MSLGDEYHEVNSITFRDVLKENYLAIDYGETFIHQYSLRRREYKKIVSSLTEIPEEILFISAVIL